MGGAAAVTAGNVPGAISSPEEEQELAALNEWVEEQGLPRGTLSYGFVNPATGEQKAVFDLAWPNGVQEELSQPVAVLLNEEPETVGLASQGGYRVFTTGADFRAYVTAEILGGAGA